MLDEHLKAGGTRENYTPATDALVEKFNYVFETYKKNIGEYQKRRDKDESTINGILLRLREKTR